LYSCIISIVWSILYSSNLHLYFLLSIWSESRYFFLLDLLWSFQQRTTTTTMTISTQGMDSSATGLEVTTSSTTGRSLTCSVHWDKLVNALRDNIVRILVLQLARLSFPSLLELKSSVKQGSTISLENVPSSAILKDLDSMSVFEMHSVPTRRVFSPSLSLVQTIPNVWWTILTRRPRMVDSWPHASMFLPRSTNALDTLCWIVLLSTQPFEHALDLVKNLWVPILRPTASKTPTLDKEFALSTSLVTIQHAHRTLIALDRTWFASSTHAVELEESALLLALNSIHWSNVSCSNYVQ